MAGLPWLGCQVMAEVRMCGTKWCLLAYPQVMTAVDARARALREVMAEVRLEQTQGQGQRIPEAVSDTEAYRLMAEAAARLAGTAAHREATPAVDGAMAAREESTAAMPVQQLPRYVCLAGHQSTTALSNT